MANELHTFTGNEVIATELPELLNQNFNYVSENSLKSVNGVEKDENNNVDVTFLTSQVIPTNSDLNNFRESGEYTRELDTIVVANSPTEKPFFLTVLASENLVKQVVTEIDLVDPITFTRTLSGANWSPWVEPTPNMQGATASADGKAGIVPSPKIADRSKVLRGDGTWGNAPVADALSGTVPITKGGTEATTVANARKNLSVNIQTFTEFSQLGLTATATELEIAAKMPSNSVFIQGVNKNNNPNLQVYSDSTVAIYGRLIITKISSNNFIFEYFGSEGGGYWFATGNSSVTKLKYYKSFLLDNGYVTKNLLFNNNALIINTKNDYYLGLFGDSQTWNIGALLALYGSEHSANAGHFMLRARSSQGNRTLQGNPNGSLTWDGKGIALEGSLSMPSSNQINLSLASGDTYTAPADGWLFLRVTAPSSSTYCDLIVQNTTSGIQTRQRDNQGLNLRAYVPLAKGQVGKVEYTNGTLHTAIFVYAQSEV